MAPKDPGDRAGGALRLLQVRQSILDAADELFAEQPVREIERREVCAAAGVSAAVFDQCFASMDELLLILVSRRHQRWMLDLVRHPSWTAATTPKGQLLAFFDVFDAWIAHGRQADAVALVRLAVDQGPQDPLGKAGIEHLAAVRAAIADVARQYGTPDPEAFARDWHILIKGALVAAVEGDTHAFRRARDIAERLLASRTAS